MAKYSRKELNEVGIAPLARWLITAAKNRETLTYGQFKNRLMGEFDFPEIFSTHLGGPAGAMMDILLEYDESLPLLNVLLVRESDGMPGKGAAYYMANRLNRRKLRKDGIRQNDKAYWRECFEIAANEVYEYEDWDEVYQSVFGTPFVEAIDPNSPKNINNSTEKDGRSFGGGGEGPNHKRLREWVLNNPSVISPKYHIIDVKTEFPLLSGDRVDVVYFARTCTISIEVKSRDSNEADLERGVYQCIKYRAVLQAQDPRKDWPIQTLLITEEPLPQRLAALASLHKVSHKVIDMEQI